MTDTANHMTEDTTFPFGGYWKGTLAEVIDGDGVRMTASLSSTCHQVEAIIHTEGMSTVFLSDRNAHVARVLSDAFHRPLEGMSADSDLRAVTLPSSTTCWIRL